jgi:hypothetical protein
MRSVDENGFGAKVREWNRTEMVELWRERWAELANERLAELDIDARIDHRSLEEQGIALEPQSQIGAPAQRIEGEGVEAADRAELHHEIARNNGRGSSPIRPLRWTPSRTSNRLSRAGIWRCSPIGTVTRSSSSASITDTAASGASVRWKALPSGSRWRLFMMRPHAA